MYAAVPRHGVNRATMVQLQVEPAAARANVIPITKGAGGSAEDHHLRAGHVVRVLYQTAAVARRLLHANRDAR